jgi:NAD(P) transhydrogenase subunit beta
MIGMAIAVLATVFGPRVTPGGIGWIAVALVAAARSASISRAP